jgi:hypothetical protein
MDFTITTSMIQSMTRTMIGLLALLLISIRPAYAETESVGQVLVPVFEEAVIHWQEGEPEVSESDGYNIRHAGQTIERRVELPAAPVDQRDAKRIVIRVELEALMSTIDGKLMPNDRWTRLGNVTVRLPGEPDDTGEPPQIELIRFVTGYGAGGVWERDITSLAPYLHGEQSLRAFVSTYSEKPGWKMSVSLLYSDEGVGQRRPVFAQRLFNDLHVTAESHTMSRSITMPDGLGIPRVHILSTGHATDGNAGNEFVSCTHILRVDGEEVARWRPWAEEGGSTRALNPWTGRRTVDGRELRASDFDRSGWHPGLMVEPYIIPVPELTPGTHHIQLEIDGIRRKGPTGPDGKRHHGYFAVSAVVVADEPWPDTSRNK